MEADGPFTRKLWMTVQPIYEQIINCIYVKRLADGTLPRNWLAHYLSQDALYLIDDSRALAVTAARAQNPEEMYFFLKLAKDGLDIERALQKEFIQLFNIPKAIEKSPAFNAYANFLINNAFNSPYPVAVAALLPCFWIYYKTGQYVFNNTVDNNPYRKWIDTYSGDDYIQ
ncbi:MAG: TenA family protein, partial [Calditrichaceae bacterium]|nr:TenA family protein [Calditrichaceae bacterium]